MKKRITLALLSLFLSACSVSSPKSGVTVTRAVSGEKEDRIAINITAPVNEVTTYRNTRKTDYVKAVTTETLKDGSHSVLPIWDKMTYGTVINADIVEDKGKYLLISLDITHSCQSELKKFVLADGNWLNLPTMKTTSGKQKMLIKHGEVIRISAAAYDSPCAFPRVIIHPSV